METVAAQGWEWAGVVVTQGLVIALTLLDKDGYDEAADRWMAALAWPALASVALLRADIVGRQPVHMAGLGAIAVGCVISATGFKPSLVAGSSVKRKGVTVRSLAARQIAGWISIIPASGSRGGLDLPP